VKYIILQYDPVSSIYPFFNSLFLQGFKAITKKN
jgi:hypothetical protein